MYEYAPHNFYKEMVYCELKLFFFVNKNMRIFYHYILGGQSVKGTAMGWGQKRFFEPEYRPAAEI